MKTKSELLEEMRADKVVLEKYFDNVIIEGDGWDMLTICIIDDDGTVYSNSVPYKPDPVPVVPEKGTLVMNGEGRILYSMGEFLSHWV